MGPRDSAALKRFLHMHGPLGARVESALAERAGFFALPGLNQCPGESGQVTSITILQGPDLPAQELKAHLLQERECAERDSAVFFSS